MITITKCYVCGRDDFKNQRGVDIHTSRKHKAGLKDDTGTEELQGTLDRKEKSKFQILVDWIKNKFQKLADWIKRE